MDRFDLQKFDKETCISSLKNDLFGEHCDGRICIRNLIDCNTSEILSMRNHMITEYQHQHYIGGKESEQFVNCDENLVVNQNDLNQPIFVEDDGRPKVKRIFEKIVKKNRSYVSVVDANRLMLVLHRNEQSGLLGQISDFINFVVTQRILGTEHPVSQSAVSMILSTPHTPLKHQELHYDYNPDRLGSQHSFGCLVFLQGGTMLFAEDKSEDFNAGDVLLFKGTIRHAGAGYDHLNLRLHYYFDWTGGDIGRSLDGTYSARYTFDARNRMKAQIMLDARNANRKFKQSQGHHLNNKKKGVDSIAPRKDLLRDELIATRVKESQEKEI